MSLESHKRIKDPQLESDINANIYFISLCSDLICRPNVAPLYRVYNEHVLNTGALWILGNLIKLYPV